MLQKCAIPVDLYSIFITFTLHRETTPVHLLSIYKIYIT